MEDSFSILTAQEFSREMAGYRDSPHMFFLGAGASVSSGLPSAMDCIRDWKRRLFESEHGAAGTETDLDTWIRSKHGYPPPGSDEEYAFYAGKCYPRSEARRRYFETCCKQASPSLGYQLLALIAKAGIAKAVWTTNYDDLAIKACMSISHTVREVCLDTATRARPPFRNRELLHVALHGDYRYDLLKNLAAEVQQQDEVLRTVLKRRIDDYPLIVIGYSGRDQSIMSTLADAYSQQVSGSLYWCGLSAQPNAAVASLLGWAASHANIAAYIPGSTFDKLLTELARHTLEGDLLESALQLTRMRAKPAPVLEQSRLRERASINLAATLLARAVNSAGFPDGVWLSISDLPGIRVDRTSIQALPERDVIFRVWLSEHPRSPTSVWVRARTVPTDDDGSRISIAPNVPIDTGGALALERVARDVVAALASEKNTLI